MVDYIVALLVTCNICLSLDLSYLLQWLSCHSTSQEHWNKVKRLLQFWKTLFLLTCSFDLLSPWRSLVTTLPDSNWVGDKDKFLSTSAFIVYLGGTLISWASKHQRTITQPSTEAEYRAIATTTVEVNLGCFLLGDLDPFSKLQAVLYCDNFGPIYLCKNPIFHSSMKHLALVLCTVKRGNAYQRIRIHILLHWQSMPSN